MKVKYDPLVEPLTNEHYGFTFQRNNYGHSVFPASRSARTRQINQFDKMQNLQKAVRFWRTMSAEIKLNWSNFTAAHPQASRRNPALFLTGYQLFLKRNHYCFLNHGILSDFMTEPVLTALSPPDITFSIEHDKNTLDCTENYIKNFGILPQVGDYILIKIFPMDEVSGAFFEYFEQTILVDQIYLDGLFVSFGFPTPNKSLSFSVYLSKIFYRSQKYQGTKTRYMGCYTPKTFLELTDTPDTLLGQDGKVVTVNEGTGELIFADGGGGGLTCEDLPDCPTIIEITSNILTIGEVISGLHNISVPVIKFGLLYNSYIIPLYNLMLRDGFCLPTRAQWSLFGLYLSATGTAGGQLKDTDLEFWIPPNTGALNSFGFNWRGNGERYYTDGTFHFIRNNGPIWLNEPAYGGKFEDREARYNTDSVHGSASYKANGLAIRAFRPAVGVADGVTGVYVGNNSQIYRTIVIDENEWLADNLVETKWNDGSNIPEITDNIAWTNLITPALCAYNNDWGNV